MNKPRIAVLLSSYNGSKYIVEQIESVLNQVGVFVDIFIRDDGSTDNTIKVLSEFENRGVRVICGSNVGVVDSFFLLINSISGYDYYALCDQDDVWDNDKLYIAVNYLKNSNIPSMYFSTTRVVDEHLNILQEKSANLVNKVYDSVQVLLSNNATGCTMVFNSSLRSIISSYKPHNIIMHDHWIYAVCVLLGGFVYCDELPHISYRQHDHNELGNKISLKKRFSISSFRNGKRIRSSIASQIYNAYYEFLPKDSIEILLCFSSYRNSFAAKRKLLEIINNSHLETTRKIVTDIEILLGVL